MTQYTGEASTKQKLKGVVDGIIAAITQRLHDNKQIHDETELRKKLKDQIDEVHDAAEEKRDRPQDIPAHVDAIKKAIAEHVPATSLTDPKMVTQVVRNLVQEANSIGKGK